VGHRLESAPHQRASRHERTAFVYNARKKKEVVAASLAVSKLLFLIISSPFVWQLEIMTCRFSMK